MHIKSDYIISEEVNNLINKYVNALLTSMNIDKFLMECRIIEYYEEIILSIIFKEDCYDSNSICNVVLSDINLNYLYKIENNKLILK